MPYYTDPNQTKFSLEEPLFEQTGQIPGPENPEPVVRTPLLKQKKFVIALIAGVTLFVLLVLFMLNAYITAQKKVQDEAPPDSQAQPDNTSNDPLYLRIKSAQQELKDADPSEQDLVYPSMDYNIRIDKKEDN